MDDKYIIKKAKTNKDKDQELFLAEVRQNPLLEKEEAYYKLNSELQKKTSEIFEKIEKYSKNRIEKFKYLEAGDYNSQSENEIDPNSDGIEKIKYSNGSRVVCNEERLHTARSLHTIPTRAKRSNIPDASLSSRSKSFSATTDTTQLFGSQSDITNHQTRLQKATESVVKCLQSKLVNYESRLADLHLQFRQKIQENTMLESKGKALEEERERLLRNMAVLQSSVEKHSKVAEASKNNVVIKNSSINSMKREIDELKREQRLSNGQIQSLQTRLHRSVEETERLKTQNKSIHLHLKEIQAEARNKADEQNQRIVQLEQQKSILSSSVSKQAHALKTLREHKKLLKDA